MTPRFRAQMAALTVARVSVFHSAAPRRHALYGTPSPEHREGRRFFFFLSVLVGSVYVPQDV